MPSQACLRGPRAGGVLPCPLSVRSGPRLLHRSALLHLRGGDPGRLVRPVCRRRGAARWT
eukprot:11706454-Alexandrium_andersonii.AAC.1